MYFRTWGFTTLPLFTQTTLGLDLDTQLRSARFAWTWEETLIRWPESTRHNILLESGKRSKRYQDGFTRQDADRKPTRRNNTVDSEAALGAGYLQDCSALYPRFAGAHCRPNRLREY